MNTMPHKREIIDRYLLDELTESERESFEEEIREDESLRQEVDLMRHISIALQRKGEKDAWHKHVSAKYKRRLIVVLSAVAAAAVAIVIFLRQGSEPAYTGEQLFADYFIAGELEIVPQRGGTITAEVARNE
ncbi:MAG: hypothetical protein LBM08_16045, partial [Dysgonamonadaceae bacterium]|nr:hypothetical protein [Dysgonamonadaceae bacterium]